MINACCFTLFFFMTMGAYFVERWNEKFWAHQFAHNLD